jgi:transposase
MGGVDRAERYALGGLDVHARATAVAGFDDVTGDGSRAGSTGARWKRSRCCASCPGRSARCMRRARRATGWSGARGRRASRWRSARRGSIERRPGDRTQDRPARRDPTGGLFAAGDLRLVWIPGEEQEQLRDLVRCREDLRADLMRARHRLQTFSLRRERYFSGPGGRWTLKQRQWLSQQHFDDRASRITYADYLHAHDVLLARRERVGRELEQFAGDCVWADTIARLCCLLRL